MTRFISVVGVCAALLLSAIGWEQSRGQGFFILAQWVTRVIANPATYPSDVNSINSLVAYWRMNDAAGCPTLADASASGLIATIAGTVTCGSTSLLTGSAVTSALFNGTTGTASLGSAGETFFHNWDYTRGMCFEALIEPNFTRAGGVFEGRAIWSKQSDVSPFPGIEFGVYFNDAVANKAVLGFELINNSSTAWMRQEGSTDLTNGSVWYVQACYDGSGIRSGITLTVNGNVEVLTGGGQASISATVINNIVPQLGSRNNTQFYFKGNIQELAIYGTGISTTSTLTTSNVFDSGKPFYHYGLSIGRPGLSTIINPRVILDVTLSSDVDSVTPIALAEMFHKKNEIKLVGVVTSSVNNFSADSAYAISNYLLGSPQSFVGAWQGAVPITNGAANSPYTSPVSSTFGANTGRSSYTDSVQKTRALLAAQPDNSVIYIVADFPVTAQGLMNSAANAGGDGLPSGATLIQQKVIRLSMNAGCYPSSGANCLVGNNPEYNMVNGPTSSMIDIFSNWPTEIVVTGIELAGAAGTNTGNIYAGPASVVATNNAVALAWNQWGTTPRTDWDGLSVFCAIKQAAGGCVPAGLRGTNTITLGTGANTWNTSSGNTTWMRLSAQNSAFIALINAMYAALPVPCAAC